MKTYLRATLMFALIGAILALIFLSTIPVSAAPSSRCSLVIGPRVFIHCPPAKVTPTPQPRPVATPTPRPLLDRLRIPGFR